MLLAGSAERTSGISSWRESLIYKKNTHTYVSEHDVNDRDFQRLKNPKIMRWHTNYTVQENWFGMNTLWALVIFLSQVGWLQRSFYYPRVIWLVHHNTYLEQANSCPPSVASMLTSEWVRCASCGDCHLLEKCCMTVYKTMSRIEVDIRRRAIENVSCNYVVYVCYIICKLYFLYRFVLCSLNDVNIVIIVYTYIYEYFKFGSVR